MFQVYLDEKALPKNTLDHMLSNLLQIDFQISEKFYLNTIFRFWNNINSEVFFEMLLEILIQLEENKNDEKRLCFFGIMFNCRLAIFRV